MRQPDLEIAVNSAAGALTACTAGADRAELCTAMELGGLTPSEGQSEAVLNAVEGRLFGIHALIRPRPGDFVYDDAEAAIALREVAALVRQGVHGVVIGALREDGTADLTLTRALADAAKAINPDVEVTFHRAIDHSADPVGCLRSLAGIGVDRVLTSGQARRAVEGLEVLRALVDVAAGEIQIMAGGGVHPDDIAVLRESGLGAVHLSAKQIFSRGNSRISLGSNDGADPDAYFVTNPDIVLAAARAIAAPVVQ
ncbi:copper homeostasis protein CutC [Saxibacter everestensis]|uniref:PF03932 family protein CutC n=1 Tax=Saxibacter everestensis TaxID=2909229 RepID=A0ABY8QT28_9MICO|nr:copper homeostasis protein CutC [Brevibacteriaceae bacterium ZFBP1038]